MSTQSGKSVWMPRSEVVLQVAYDDGTERSVGGVVMPAREFAVTPKSWSVTLNDFRSPDEFMVELSFRDVPMDPSLIRAMTVQIYLGMVERAEDRIAADPSELLLIGHADQIEETWDEEGQMVRISGRDETALFLDTKWPRNLSVPLNKPVDQAIRDIIGIRNDPDSETPSGKAFPAVEGFEVVWEGPGSPPNAGTKKRKRRDMTASFKEATLWDVIYTVAQHAGVIIEVAVRDRESKIVLRQPSTLTPADADEYVFLYGKNLERLRIARELGRISVPNVEVSCVIGKKVVRATYPDPIVVTDWDSKGRPKEKRVVPYGVSGFKDHAALKAMAESLWHQIGRKETSLDFSTRDLESFNDRDMTALRAGHAVRLQVDPDDKLYFGNLSAAERSQRLRALGYAEEVAAEISRNWEVVTNRPRTYFLDQLTLHWSHTEGLGFEGKALNFLGGL